MNNVINILETKDNVSQNNILQTLENISIEELNKTNPPILFDENENITSFWNADIWKFCLSRTKSQESIVQWKAYNQLSENYLNELKYITLVLYYKNYKHNRKSNFIKTIISNINVFISLSKLLNYHSICELSNDLSFITLMEKIKGKYSYKTLMADLTVLRLASELNNKNFPLNVNLQKNKISKKTGFDINDLAIKYSKKQSESVEQTLYIPNKIHSKLISTCIDFIEKKRECLSNMMDFLEEDFLIYEKVKKDLNMDEYDREMHGKIQVIKRKETKKLFHKHNLSQFSFVTEIQKEIKLLATACSILMLNFSGMRINELTNIEVDGFKVIDSEPKLYVLRSYETKLSGGQIVDYITSPIVKDAFDILNIIHAFAKKYDSTTNPKNLFITSKHQKLLTYGRKDSIMEHISTFAKDINLVIDFDDVKESELLNGPREEIQVGKIWPLASHQFRRTLIINFVSHRLGTINAVKQQVKHMYANMTEYYAKNSKLAEAFNLSVVKEISENIEEELLNESVKQYKHFHYSDEPLAGIKGEEIMGERNLTKVLSDDEIKQLFKTGLYQISKSMYGYCTKGNLCDKKEVIDPTFCGASCNTMIITKENALNWQKLYFKNSKILSVQNNLMLSGIPMNAAKTTIQSQNEVAKSIMNKFNIKYEDK